MPRTILITGATRGLGRALAERWASEGHRLVVCGRDPVQVAELQALLGEGHLASVLDVADAAAVEAWAREVLPRFGAPDLLINNAGIIYKRAPPRHVPAAERSQVIDFSI